MVENTIQGLVRIANSSNESDTSVISASREFGSNEEATEFYADLCERLLRVEEWNKNSGATEYQLFGDDAEKGRIKVDIFIRIKLYGSGKPDWVRVESIIDHPDERVIRVRPSYDPTDHPVDKSVTSHFFVPDATNNFCAGRSGRTVSMYVIGLSEKQNIAFTDGLIESARNAAVANVGYYTRLQHKVWKSFCENFLKLDEENGE